ncbi:hypothetical protein KSP35_03770 [Aquihabitans sp. G128]|uniref:hypothetical protein n=1 Tax=Aquihabitans sp. G128 TaxID=2849779 RepID=UPI001C21CBB6|nr:hypothetical protein [Aquihabitans sp. G128]QXC61947.1 hypothetical protein KSP35_03770 [Aquihabitans sp. G128]
MTSLADKIVTIHAALDSARVPHAFGGALALAWCTERARGTIDIDVNVFLDAAEADAVVAALPPAVTCRAADLDLLRRDGQARLWWDATPVDLFLDTTEFHRRAAGRTRSQPFAGAEVPFLACVDLAVFKAFFDRTKDWADLEEMAGAGTLDVERVAAVLTTYLGADDPRIDRLRTLG